MSGRTEIKLYRKFHGPEFCDWVERWEATVTTWPNCGMAAELSLQFHCEGEDRDTELTVCFLSLRPRVRSHDPLTATATMKVLDCPLLFKVSCFTLDQVKIEWRDSPVEVTL